ncbi:MAG: OmpH family outer membrane protein [Bacteroidales bacterium]|jgi:outer membrane protein
MSSEKKNKTLIIISIVNGVIAIAAISIAIYLYITTPRIGFIHNSRILTEYNGVKAGKKVYQDKVNTYKANLDSLQMQVNKMIQIYKEDEKKLNPKEKKERQEQIKQRQMDFMNFRNGAEKMIKEEDDKISSAILKQVNTYIYEYAKKKHYDFVFGSTTDGSLFYGSDKFDITEEVLKELNNKYEGK